jgi:hypothetical protein
VLEASPRSVVGCCGFKIGTELRMHQGTSSREHDFDSLISTSEHLAGIQSCMPCRSTTLATDSTSVRYPITGLLEAGIHGPRDCAPQPRFSTCFSCHILNLPETNNPILPLPGTQERGYLIPGQVMSQLRTTIGTLIVHDLDRAPWIRSAPMNYP